MDYLKRVGITEGYDPAYNFDWVESKYAVNIIITKSLTDDVIEGLLKMKDRVILHLTCTGLNGRVERNSYTMEKQCDKLNLLLEKGFSTRQVVLRVDPIIPTKLGIQTARSVIEHFYQSSPLFKDNPDIGDNRVRYSFLDLYPHVKKRFENNNIKKLWNRLEAYPSDVSTAVYSLVELEEEFKLSLEACAENTFKNIIPERHLRGCVSKLDIDILNADMNLVSTPYKQRKTCYCEGQKNELIPIRKPCPNECLYCYWKTEIELNE